MVSRRTWNSRPISVVIRRASPADPHAQLRQPGTSPARLAGASCADASRHTDIPFHSARGRRGYQAARNPASPIHRLGGDSYVSGPRTDSVSCSNICVACSHSFSHPRPSPSEQPVATATPARIRVSSEMRSGERWWTVEGDGLGRVSPDKAILSCPTCRPQQSCLWVATLVRLAKHGYPSSSI
jgi:hypothetical protein